MISIAHSSFSLSSANLLPPPTPSRADGDFILLSEFSEIAGPVPLLTYPPGGGQLFDRNGFVLRVMAVDFQNKAAAPSMPGLARQDIQVWRYGLRKGRGFNQLQCIAHITSLGTHHSLSHTNKFKKEI